MKYAVVIIALVVLALLIMDFNGRTAELNRLTVQREKVSAQLNENQQTQAALETSIAYATSEAAVIEYGYKNHMVRPGDIPVVPVPPPMNTPVPTPRPVVAPTEVSNWQRWLSLFVDPPKP